MAIYPPSNDQYLSGGIQKDGAWEPKLLLNMKDVINNHSSKDDVVVFDIGANIGEYSVYAASLGHKTFTFEMMKDSYAKLCATAKRNPTIKEKLHIFTGALSD